MGPRHAEAAAGCELTELVAVADLIPERARETAARFDVARVYGPGSDLIADPDVDLVVLDEFRQAQLTEMGGAAVLQAGRL